MLRLKEAPPRIIGFHQAAVHHSQAGVPAAVHEELAPALSKYRVPQPDSTQYPPMVLMGVVIDAYEGRLDQSALCRATAAFPPVTKATPPVEQIDQTGGDPTPPMPPVAPIFIGPSSDTKGAGQGSKKAVPREGLQVMGVGGGDPKTHQNPPGALPMKVHSQAHQKRGAGGTRRFCCSLDWPTKQRTTVGMVPGLVPSPALSTRRFWRLTRPLVSLSLEITLKISSSGLLPIKIPPGLCNRPSSRQLHVSSQLPRHLPSPPVE